MCMSEIIKFFRRLILNMKFEDYLKAIYLSTPILANFLSTIFYDLKIMFVYTGVIAEYFMSKCTREVWVF